MSDEWEVEKISDDEYRLRRVGTGAGLGGLAVLGAIGYIIKGVVDWVSENWIYIVSVVGIVIACIIACIIIAYKSKKNNGVKIAVAIITSGLLIVGVFTILPKIINGLSKHSENIGDTYSEVSEPEYFYMYVDAEKGLNMRSSPDASSSSNIVIALPRNAEVKILNSEFLWYYVEYVGDRIYTGYVNSKYLRY